MRWLAPMWVRSQQGMWEDGWSGVIREVHVNNKQAISINTQPIKPKCIRACAFDLRLKEELPLPRLWKQIWVTCPYTNKKPGIVMLAKTLIAIGQKSFNRAWGWCQSIPTLWKQRSVYRPIRGTGHSCLNQIRKIGYRTVFRAHGYVRWLERENPGRKHYDLILYCFEFGNPHPVTSVVESSMKSKIMFLMEYTGAEDARSLRSSFKTWLKNLYDVDFADVLLAFTSVTDFESTTLCITTSSSSSNKVPFNERWLGCICHQVNDFMKHVMSKEESV